ncbi:unnamed protein product [Didymodactylos carnosus]|uniref:Uncharacterized protein n=1 Tax=Didymodactylos carnosus TaxID=1234261 RepID=A0A815CS01_9BILA|nr:unnamed protein product [Didymodactylos carnosus]CAF1288176.1 unnamed protein product [Didymodactylos carnosus]CAF3999810.1 unnamed protein product [Didymodactylos carnosus]CAF4091704.1 unnamed protein product [Didymodactylos carnosus]
MVADTPTETTTANENQNITNTSGGDSQEGTRIRTDGVRQQQAVQHQNGLNRQHNRRSGNGSGRRVRGRSR